MYTKKLNIPNANLKSRAKKNNYISDLNITIKKQNLLILNKKAKCNYKLSIKTINNNSKRTLIKEKEWEKIYYTNTHQIKPGMVILLSGKVDFKSRNIIRDKHE